MYFILSIKWVMKRDARIFPLCHRSMYRSSGEKKKKSKAEKNPDFTKTGGSGVVLKTVSCWAVKKWDGHTTSSSTKMKTPGTLDLRCLRSTRGKGELAAVRSSKPYRHATTSAVCFTGPAGKDCATCGCWSSCCRAPVHKMQVLLMAPSGTCTISTLLSACFHLLSLGPCSHWVSHSLRIDFFSSLLNNPSLSPPPFPITLMAKER